MPAVVLLPLGLLVQIRTEVAFNPSCSRNKTYYTKLFRIMIGDSQEKLTMAIGDRRRYQFQRRILILISPVKLDSTKQA